MMRRAWIKLMLVAACSVGGFAVHRSVGAQQQGAQPSNQQHQSPLPDHPPAGDGKTMVVQLCDGETNLEVKGVRSDERLSPEQAQKVSDQLMAMWMAKQPPEVAAAWARDAAQAQQKAAAQRKSAATQKAQGGSGDSASKEQTVDFSPRDYQIWKRELEREVAEGDKIFHDDKLLGSTNGVSCAMCHPNAANTHPETYPKFQIQLKRVALLRDMINWCIENPSRGPRLAADDPKMRALEAYIMSQRKGVAMEPGKH
jgi:thiosulfate dehydrogenase